MIHPIGLVDRSLLEWLADALAQVYSIRTAVGPQLEPPMTAYDWGRGQYRSEEILRMLASMRAPSSAVLGVANVDAYADALNFVFGEAILGGWVAVVYLPRLDPRFYGEPPSWEVLSERLLKEALHELGHAFGLTHCPTPGCVMNFSNSIWEVDEKKPAYCPRCARRLEEAAGIRVNPDYILWE